ncbi:MAG: Holliday junction resolvase-like protein [Dehalococcoidales bacterium]
MEVIALVAIVVVVAILGIFLTYYFTKLKFEGKFRQWQETEKLGWEEERERARKEAITQSRAVLGGKFVEQLAPYLPEFKYDPTEARFIGSPIDLIVFPGLASGDPEEIVIMEIKTGKTGQLKPHQKKIRQLIENGMVRWELIQKPTEGEG